jgi:N,N'-diacetyllegionaminate synthase
VSAALAVGDRVVGDGHPCFVVAEAGVNHNGRPDLAHRLVEAAAAAGADAVKFQTFRPEALVAAGAAAAPYQRARGATAQDDMLRSLVLPASAWGDLAGHAAEHGLLFLSTAFDEASAAIVADLGVPALKIPSGELDNLPFIRQLAAHRLPLLISTGMGTLDEVAAAIDAARAAPGVALFHCVTAYPAPPLDANLRAIPTMRERFRVPVGWSDHTPGSTTAVAAVALGATLLEKHLTTDRALPGPDHAASADPDQFAAYIRDVRDTEGALGDGVKRPAASEEENRVHARRSLHATHDLAPGDVLGAGDVVALRPATGIAPGTDVSGRTIVRPVPAGAPITGDDLA